MDPSKCALLACTAYATQQTTFFMYHYNSHAANPIMLRSPKPQVMRDIFLVPCNLNPATEWYRFLNPLPGVYAFSLEDALVNSFVMGAVGGPLIQSIGFGHVTAVYALGAIFSGFAYVFQMQCSRTKKSTEFDCCASSQGALAALCSLSLLMPAQRVPWTRSVPTSLFATLFIFRSLVEEYGFNPFNPAAYHKWFRTSKLALKSCSGGENLSGNEFFKRANGDFSDLEDKYFTSSSGASLQTPNGSKTNASEWELSAVNTGHIELTNWGSIGGIFLGLIYGSLVIGVKKDFSKMGKFWSRMPGAKGSAASSTSSTKKNTTPPPSWGA